MVNLENEVVLVTGASGFVGSHVVRQLLEEGFNVRGTVRDLSAEEKVKPLKELCPDAKHPLELVQADLTKEEGWESALDGCRYVIHVASPYPMKAPTTQEEVDSVLKVSVDGFTTLLTACKKAHISRLVLTSSCVAIFGSTDLATVDAAKIYTEEDWAEDTEKMADTYAKSKKVQEKAAWDFVKELPEEEKFEVVAINPSFVMGPLITNQVGTSAEICKMILEKGGPPMQPKVSLPICDVRDVATAHVKALTCPEAAGQRHIVYSSSMWLKEVAQVMAKEFKPQGYSIATMGMPKFGVKIVSLWDKKAKAILPSVGKSIQLGNNRMKEVLEIEPRDVKETIIDMCYSMIERGLAKKTKKYYGPNGPKKAAEEEATNGEANGEANGENGAATNGDKNGEANGATNGDAAPATNGDAAPATNGDATEEKPAEINGEAPVEEETPVVEEKKEAEPEKEPETPAAPAVEESTPEETKTTEAPSSEAAPEPTPPAAEEKKEE